LKAALQTAACCLAAIAGTAASAAPATGAWAPIPGGLFKSALSYEDLPAGSRVAPYELMQRPVTNGEYLGFVRAHPEWSQGRVPVALGEARYLSHWQSATSLGPVALVEQPVTWVSWFAASAYCEAQGARLPTWQEWEFAAAADETRADARADPSWRERILAWYARPSSGPLPRAGATPANVYGVQDMHGLVWEWVDDASALLVSADDREQGSADRQRFCGAGALSMDDRDNYAILMRVAMLSSLAAADATGNLGFRCARDAP
jgi:formylglycine-generating enzyme required for sulfatase activity